MPLARHERRRARYEAYHDTEWGVPEWDSRALWEKLVLDGFQAGLAWITILRKREAFRAAFADFDPEIVARFGEADRHRLMNDAGIIRSNGKIDAAISGAKIFLEMRDRGEDFSHFLWAFTGGAPIQNRFVRLSQVPAQTPLAADMAKALKAKGFKFCGPVIVYAFMQAVGMVNDHISDCFRHGPVSRMTRPLMAAAQIHRRPTRRSGHAAGGRLPDAGLRCGRGRARAARRAGVGGGGDPAPRARAPRASNDSKKLTAKARERLEIQIKETAIAWAVAFASVEEIAELNVLHAAGLAMRRAVEGLKTQGRPARPWSTATTTPSTWSSPVKTVIGGDGRELLDRGGLDPGQGRRATG